MRNKRQNNQLELAFMIESKGEAPATVVEGTESRVAEDVPQSPALDQQLMEEVCERENLKKALERVKANQGSSGIDGMTVDQLPEYLRNHWPTIRGQLLSGAYRPQPVKRVEIAKPGGGVRKLGIPTVVDRFIQQAVMQVLQSRWDPTFSPHSYGFRPGRSAHQAIAQAQKHIAEGYRYVVDIDLEKFFDRVCHDKLMGLIAKRIGDKRVLKLIRAFLTAGAMENGLVSPSEEGTPQGGPLSPLLSNLMLDLLDKELERRGHRFCRYADDCNVYVQSWRAGERVMKSIGNFIANQLKLKVNVEKSAVARPWARKFLGFSFTSGTKPKRRIAPQALNRFRERVRELTQRTRGINLKEMIEELATYLKGWRGYFAFSETSTVLQRLDQWIRRRLRCFVWKQWKTGHRRYVELRKWDVGDKLAAQTAGSNQGPWHISMSPALSIALSDAYFDAIGLPRLSDKRRA
jgi:RNA-directed DNA polymerase